MMLHVFTPLAFFLLQQCNASPTPKPQRTNQGQVIGPDANLTIFAFQQPDCLEATALDENKKTVLTYGTEYPTLFDMTKQNSSPEPFSSIKTSRDMHHNEQVDFSAYVKGTGSFKTKGAPWGDATPDGCGLYIDTLPNAFKKGCYNVKLPVSCMRVNMISP